MARSKKASSEAPAKSSTPRAERTLPDRRNPMLRADKTPAHNELVSKRRLGRTDLQVKADQVGNSSATKKENLGTIEYAYLGAPLPEDLAGSEIFAPTAGSAPPEEYFMMRRSKDGFVSATGMFKVAFPWAKHDEEKAEREYLHTLQTTHADEQAGNIWINEHAALTLADDYEIRNWVVALLDPEHPSTEPHKRTSQEISPPPKFEFKAGGDGRVSDLPAPASSPSKTGSKRGKRSQSPSKLSKSASSPRKRLTKAAKEASASAAKAASESLQNALDTAASVAGSEGVADLDVSPKINGVARSPKGDVFMDGVSDDKVTVQVESTVETNGDIETTHTNVKVQMPADSPELPLPEDTEKMIADAKRMVEEAAKIQANGEVPAKGKSKRKAEAIEDDEDDEIAAQAAEGRELQPAKKARLMEQEVRTQKVRSRALMGVAATLTIGAIIPYFIGA